jgi:hypothetical protein
MRMKAVALLAILLASFIIISRVHFIFPYLYSWDSVQFALSIHEFDVTKHQPHPPGYILYSGLLRIVNSFMNDPNRTIIAINIVASLIASFFVALLVFELIPSSTPSIKLLLACAASALYATNPINWFYGSVAEIYPLEGCLVGIAVYLFLIALRRSEIVPWIAIFLGVVGGIRLTTELFLLPAYFYLLLRTTIRSKIISLICISITNLVWFIPLIYLSHGLSSYFHVVFNQFGREPSRTAGFHVDVFSDIVTAFVQTITLPILLFAIYGIKKMTRNANLDVVMLAIIPAFLFFLFMHYTKRGYLFVLLPSLIVLSTYLLHLALQESKWQIVVLSCAIVFDIFTCSGTDVKGNKTALDHESNPRIDLSQPSPQE